MLGFRKVVAVLGLVAAGVAQNDRPMERDWQQLDRAVRVEALRADVCFLADDLLGGRGGGTRGDALARLHLRTRLQQLGVEGGAPDGGCEQRVPIQGLTAEITVPWRATVAVGGSLALELDRPNARASALASPSSCVSSAPTSSSRRSKAPTTTASPTTVVGSSLRSSSPAQRP